MKRADADARHNVEVVDRCIAKLADSLQELQQCMNGLDDKKSQLGQKMKALKGRIPASEAPPGAALPAEWTALTFRGIDRHTRYTLVAFGGAAGFAADGAPVEQQRQLIRKYMNDVYGEFKNRVSEGRKGKIKEDCQKALGINAEPLPDHGEIMTRETADPFPGDRRYSVPPRN